MKRLLLFIGLCTMAACMSLQKAETSGKGNTGNNAETYTIAKGRHRSDQFSWQKQQMNRLDFKFTFDSTAIYQSKDPVNQGDINKLMGLSDGTIFHHKNSARFGWRWYHDQLQIWAYCYNNSKRNYQKIGVAALNEEHSATLIFAKNKYVFQMNGQSVEMARSSSKPYASGYKLLPYFGGDEKAPHDITISISVKD